MEIVMKWIREEWNHLNADGAFKKMDRNNHANDADGEWGDVNFRT